jgi:tRNA-splicing endonuclease subunit Sen34
MSTDIYKPGESSTSTLSKADTIPLYLINGIATIWDAQGISIPWPFFRSVLTIPPAAATIHCLHAISGLRVGTLPGVSQQNAFLGLPITLTPEETTHLLNKGLVHLISVPDTPRYPTQEEVRVRTEERVGMIRKLEERKMGEEEGKRREGRERFAKSGEVGKGKREERARLKREKGGSEGLFGEEVKEEVQEVKPKQPQKQVLSSGYFHTVPSHPVIPLSIPPSTTLAHFPRTPRDRALTQTFTQLHTLGLRLGLGPRFGGEYLIYPGDYLRYHAHFTSQVIVRDEMIRPGEIVAWGRLGTGTKKAGLLCCWDDGERGEPEGDLDGKGEMEFYSLEWANFG